MVETSQRLDDWVRMRKLYRAILLFFAFSLPFFSLAFALETDTHEEINEFITTNTLDGFSLDTYLQNQLGFENGIDKEFEGNWFWFITATKPVWRWIEIGGKYEDKPPLTLPYLRSVNHFHNPLTDQGFSGIWGGTEWLSGESSIQWAQEPVGTQNPGGYYSWYDVREYYYNALTSTDQDTRNTNFAKTFRGVGQLMHLIQDASVPAHTRDDGHLFYNYEDFAGSYVNEYGLPTPTSSEFFSGNINDIASFIDTNQYDGANPDPNIAVGTNIGLSEYTNANFFSKNTINSSNFPYPDIDQTTVIERAAPSGNYQRQYYLKNCCGETNGGQGYLLSAVDYLDYYRQQYPLLSSFLPIIPVLDNNVYEEYADLLIPRAVGYSAGLLDYFFRGTLEITPPAQVAYSVTDGSQTPYNDNGNLHQQFTHIKAKVRNSTPDTIPGEEVQGCDQLQQNCILQAIGRYKIIPDYMYDLSNYPPDGTTMQNIEFSYSVSGARYIDNLSSVTPQEYTFDFSADPIPTGITDLELFIVFKGTLGNETDIAIAVGKKDLMEPTHHVFWNLTDMFALNYNLYTSEDIQADPNLADLVDFDDDGVFNEIDIGEPYIYPHYNMTLEIFYMNTFPPVDPVYLSATVLLPPGRHIRLILLVDRPDNNYVRLNWNDYLNGDLYTGYYDFAFDGVINQEVDGIWTAEPPITEFRYGLDVDGITQIPIRQHFSTGLLSCQPASSPDTCPYPEEEAIPAELLPYPVTILFPQSSMVQQQGTMQMQGTIDLERKTKPILLPINSH